MEGMENNARWYVMQVMSGHELKVFRQMVFDCSADAANVVGQPTADDLDVKFNGLFNGIYELTIPYELVQGKRDESGRRGKDVRKKLYPGYVLIRAILVTEDGRPHLENLDYVRNVKSVIGLIGGKMPVALTEAEASKMLQQQQENEEHKAKPVVQFTIGETVILRKEEFFGLEGVIESIDYERQRVKVSLNIFGRYTAIDIPCGQVERP